MKGPLHYLRALRRRWDAAHLAGPAVLARFARQQPEAFFVQIGGNDGQISDPIYALVRGNRWRGLVLEPVPHLFEKLAQSYAEAAGRIQPVNLALAAEDGEWPFYHLRAKPGLAQLPVWFFEGLGSFRKEVVLKHGDRIPGIEQYLTEIRVPSVSWETLCARYQVAQVDALFIDTEGYDYEILRQVDLGRWRPGLIVYEHHHFSSETRLAAQHLLQAQGYWLFEEILDTWAVRLDAGDDLLEATRRAARRSRFATVIEAR